MTESRPETDITLDAWAGVRRAVMTALRDAVREADRLGDLEDDEAVHDFRVAVRRLRTFLRAFDDVVPFEDSIKSELRELTGLTNVTRDGEAHGEWLRKQRDDPTLAGPERNAAAAVLARLDGSSPRADGIESHSKQVLAHTGQVLAVALSEEAATDRSADTDETMGQAGADVLRQEARRLRKRLRRIKTIGDIRQIHRARLSEKRLRYVLELVEPQLPPAEPPLDRLKSLQDTLGELHDIAGLREQLTDEDETLDKVARRRRMQLFADLEADWLSTGGEAFFEELDEVIELLGQTPA